MYLPDGVIQTVDKDPDGGQLKTHSTYLVTSHPYLPSGMTQTMDKDPGSGQLKTHSTYLVTSHLYLPSGITQTVDKDPDGGQLKTHCSQSLHQSLQSPLLPQLSNMQQHCAFMEAHHHIRIVHPSYTGVVPSQYDHVVSAAKE